MPPFRSPYSAVLDGNNTGLGRVAGAEDDGSELEQGGRKTPTMGRDGYTVLARRPHTAEARMGEIMSLDRAAEEERFDSDFGPYGEMED